MNNDEEKDPNLWFLNKNVISKGKTFGIPNRNILKQYFYFTNRVLHCKYKLHKSSVCIMYGYHMSDCIWLISSRTKESVRFADFIFKY